jgi:hypothetical protein
MAAGMARTALGFVGPVARAHGELERALSLLAADPAMRQVVYLGLDDAIDEVAARWQAKAEEHRAAFLTRAAELARSGRPEAIDALLAEPDPGRELSLLRRLPEAPMRAVDMLDRFVVLAVHDKAVLDEEDIANAHAIAYGRADEPACKRFGQRCFLTPGPLSGGTIARVRLLPEGALELAVLRLDGSVVKSERLAEGGARLVVTP